MMPGNEKAARYLADVHPIYLKHCHGVSCGPRCICHRQPRMWGQFKASRYERFRAEINPIYEKSFGVKGG